MKAITLKVFKDVNTAKASAKAEGKNLKFLGIELIKHKNNKLSKRLESSDGKDTMQEIAREEAQNVVNKDNSKKRREARKIFGRSQKPGFDARKEWSKWETRARKELRALVTEIKSKIYQRLARLQRQQALSLSQAHRRPVQERQPPEQEPSPPQLQRRLSQPRGGGQQQQQQ